MIAGIVFILFAALILYGGTNPEDTLVGGVFLLGGLGLFAEAVYRRRKRRSQPLPLENAGTEAAPTATVSSRKLKGILIGSLFQFIGLVFWWVWFGNLRSPVPHDPTKAVVCTCIGILLVWFFTRDAAKRRPLP